MYVRNLATDRSVRSYARETTCRQRKAAAIIFFRLYIYCSVNAHGLSWLVAGQSNDRDEALRFQFTPRCQLLYASAGYAASLLQLQGCTVRALLDCAFVSFHTGR